MQYLYFEIQNISGKDIETIFGGWIPKMISTNKMFTWKSKNSSLMICALNF